MTSVPMKVKEEEVQRIQKLNNTMLKTTLGPNVFFWRFTQRFYLYSSRNI